ncbi:hypothetical protein AAC389_10460 [Rhodococcus qingshengii]|uniref:hypothetical protein n=1 Tax=Rhodococcus qingshengii TaxID=334542 RepID=UPI00311CBE67
MGRTPHKPAGQARLPPGLVQRAEQRARFRVLGGGGGGTEAPVIAAQLTGY